jgi:hypothetical protein
MTHGTVQTTDRADLVTIRFAWRRFMTYLFS